MRSRALVTLAVARLRGVLLAVAIMCATSLAGAAESYFPSTVRLNPEGAELTLNGTGERTIFFFHIYTIGLYLPQRRNSLHGVLALQGPKRLQLLMQRELSAKQVRDYLVKRMSDGTQPVEMAVLKARMDDISVIIDSVRVLRKGDTLALDYSPAKGTVVKINNVAHGAPIDGDEFFHALLKIWLAERTRNPALRDALLGRVPE